MTIPQHIIQLIEQNNANFKQLKLVAFGITDQDINALVDAFENNSHITSLDLSGNNITSEGAKSLALLRLDYLDVSDNNIGNTGAKYLLTSPTLKKIKLDDNGISAAVLTTLSKQAHSSSQDKIIIGMPSKSAQPSPVSLLLQEENEIINRTSQIFSSPLQKQTKPSSDKKDIYLAANEEIDTLAAKITTQYQLIKLSLEDKMILLNCLANQMHLMQDKQDMASQQEVLHQNPSTPQ